MMPEQNVQLILDRVFVDDVFRRQLEADLEGTIKSMGIELSDEGLAELMTALDEGGDFATGLDQRLSQSGISLNPAAMLRQKTSRGKQYIEYELAPIKGNSHIAPRIIKQKSITTVLEKANNEAILEPIEIDELDIEIERDQL
jgi:hypothetical protein